jgi:hypothetical protein
MALFNSSELNKIGFQITRSRNQSAEVILKESFSAYKSTEVYDIFLSHSYRDKNVILGLKDFIEKLGYTVYIDWIVDIQLDRTAVTKDTAQVLQSRMRNCKSLFFAVSGNSSTSVWMPWELGYFDGIKGKVAILPIIEDPNPTNSYHGQEYLGLYPYVVKDLQQNNGMKLWIFEAENIYVLFDRWLTGSQPSQH